MADSFTSNRNLTQPLVGGDVGTWGGILNNGVMAQLDLILGATQAISITSGDVTLSIPQWNNCAIVLTGVLTGDHNLILPFNVNSATVAVGGLFVVQNNTTGAHKVTVITAAAGSTGVTVPQGTTSYLFSDTVNVWNADSSKLQLISWSGNPNGFVAGTAGSANNPPSMVWDYTNGALYACVVTGTTSTALWNNVVSAGLPLPSPEGYLTPVSGQPIITADSIGATAVYYTPYQGSWAAAWNGLSISPYQFTQMQLTLSASQAANNIYDVFLANNSGSYVIGTGPSWAASGGSVTAGSCARGTGGGSTAINRDALSGLWVNTNSMSLIYNTGSGNNTITVPAGRGVYLGSLFIDAAAGQVTCHRSYGQSRKWGIWNAYNRAPVYLKAGDGNANWTYSTATIRPSNGSTANSLTLFSGLAEDTYALKFDQNQFNNSGSAQTHIGVGYNSTTGFSGFSPDVGVSSGGISKMFGVSEYLTVPALGINVITALEQGDSTGGNTSNWYGTETNMLLLAQWRA